MRQTLSRQARRLLRAALLRYARAEPRGGPDGRRVSILLVSAWGMGGTIRTVHAVAGHLARTHEVEILSAYRRRDEPYFPFAPGVRVTALDDERPGATAPLLRRLLRSRPSILMPPSDMRSHNYSLWTDVRLVRRLRRGRGFLVGTRPGLNVMAADLGLPGFTTIGEEHLNFHRHRPKLRAEMRRAYPGLDGFVVLTEADRLTYEEQFGDALRVWRIPNTVADIELPTADLGARRVLAAGRLTPQKGFDLLIDAFGPVARAHPDWRLDIFGGGHSTETLQGEIDARGLAEQVALRGPTADLPGEMARASVYALSSRFEGFPMVLIEAMGKGMACVAFDCPTGPGEIIDDHRNGLLVPAMDVEGLTAALMEMIEDEELRRRCGAAALETARDYTMAAIGPKWDEMIGTLVSRRA
jgi:glycosyltransferase involved in cell wall biosynthesis